MRGVDGGSEERERERKRRDETNKEREKVHALTGDERGDYVRLSGRRYPKYPGSAACSGLFTVGRMMGENMDE